MGGGRTQGLILLGTPGQDFFLDCELNAELGFWVLREAGGHIYAPLYVCVFGVLQAFPRLECSRVVGSRSYEKGNPAIKQSHCLTCRHVREASLTLSGNPVTPSKKSLHKPFSSSPKGKGDPIPPSKQP